MNSLSLKRARRITLSLLSNLDFSKHQYLEFSRCWCFIFIPVCFIHAIISHMKSLKKIFFILTSMCIVLTGCTKKDDKADAEAALYESYYESISSNEIFITQSNYYSLSGEIVQINDGTYRYSIILDSPQVAMYNVVMMAVENDIPYMNATKMMPSIGILDDQYSLVPYQSNSSRNYVKGLVISGESDTSSVNIKLLVEWTNRSHEKEFREFWSFSLDENGINVDSQENVE